MNRLPAFLFAAFLFTSCSVFKGKQPKEDVVTIKTDLGSIDLILYDQTPKHKANFLKLAKEGYYDGTTFHRIIDNFMIQGGDPNSKNSDPNDDGSGGPNYTIPAEFVPGIVHDQGSVAAARDNNPAKASSGCQFYIVENRQGAHFLDGSYTVFGKVVRGMDVVEKIAEQAKDPRDRPLKDIKMTVTVKGYSDKDFQKQYGMPVPNPVPAAQTGQPQGNSAQQKKKAPASNNMPKASE